MRTEYDVESVMMPEGYFTIIMDKKNFDKIINDKFVETTCIIYNWLGCKYYIDTSSHIVLVGKNE